MDDVISRQQAIDALDKCHCGGKDENGSPWIYKENAVEAIEMVEPLPSAQPKRGHWNHNDKYGTFKVWTCDQCGWNYEAKHNFCPHCGSDMREVTT